FGYVHNFEQASLYSRCIAFVAELTVTGEILSVSVLTNLKTNPDEPDNFHSNILPYSIALDMLNSKLIIVGEKFNTNTFDPFPSTYSFYTPEEEPGKGIILALDYNFDLQWSLMASNMLLNSTGDLSGPSLASLFSNVSITPFGYLITGQMKYPVLTPSNSINGLRRIEACLIDFNGATIWQKSVQVSNTLSKGSGGLFSVNGEKIFILYQNTYTHTFGLTAVDYATGNGNRSSEFI